MKKIVFTRPDGGVSVVSPHPELFQMAFDAIPVELNPQIIEDTDLPPTRTFRDAWTLTGTTVAVDPVKAGVIIPQPVEDV